MLREIDDNPTQSIEVSIDGNDDVSMGLKYNLEK